MFLRFKSKVLVLAKTFVIFLVFHIKLMCFPEVFIGFMEEDEEAGEEEVEEHDDEEAKDGEGVKKARSATEDGTGGGNDECGDAADGGVYFFDGGDGEEVEVEDPAALTHALAAASGLRPAPTHPTKFML